MKRFTLMLIVVCVVGWSGSAFALNGGTLGEFGKFAFSIEGESVLERGMEFEGGTLSGTIMYSGGGSDIDSMAIDDFPDCDYESNRVLMSLEVGLAPRLDLFFKAGTADANLNEFNDEFGSDYDVEFDGDFGSAWGFGLKAKLFEVGKFNFITTAEYLRYKVDSNVTEDGVAIWDEIYNPGDTSTGSAEMDVAEWEVCLLVSKSFGWFVPYVGVSYSDSDVTASIDMDYLYSNGDLFVSDWELNWEQEENLGFSLGFNVELGEHFAANVGGKFGNEKSGSFKMVYAF